MAAGMRRAAGEAVLSVQEGVKKENGPGRLYSEWPGQIDPTENQKPSKSTGV